MGPGAVAYIGIGNVYTIRPCTRAYDTSPTGRGWCPGSRPRCRSRRPSAGAVRPLPIPQRRQSSMHLQKNKVLYYVTARA